MPVSTDGLSSQQCKYALMVEEVKDEDDLNRPKGLGLDKPLLLYIYDEDEAPHHVVPL